jgi:hypothetical protein
LENEIVLCKDIGEQVSDLVGRLWVIVYCKEGFGDVKGFVDGYIDVKVFNV